MDLSEQFEHWRHKCQPERENCNARALGINSNRKRKRKTVTLGLCLHLSTYDSTILQLPACSHMSLLTNSTCQCSSATSCNRSSYIFFTNPYKTPTESVFRYYKVVAVVLNCYLFLYLLLCVCFVLIKAMWYLPAHSARQPLPNSPSSPPRRHHHHRRGT